MQLHGFFRSSAAYRVRIALNLKGIGVEHIPVHLRKGEQRAEDHLQRNPMGLVPVLQDGYHTISQSLAIIEYLEDVKPQPALLPGSPADRAWVRSLALSIACDIHPLNNLRVLNYLGDALSADAAARERWYQHWVASGFDGIERSLARDPRVGRYCFGDQPGLADVCLVPQVYNAERFNCDLSAYPTIGRIVSEARQLPAFQEALPERQADAE
jgi:maleylpyruvate isomerase